MNQTRDLSTISANLTKAGFSTDLREANALVVIRSGANKGLWIRHSHQNWYAITFIQLAYRIPSANHIENLCAECLHDEKFTNVEIPDILVEKFSLRLIDAEEHEKMEG